MEETLKSIGLAKNETKIYLALLELGPSTMGTLCGKTKIHRRNVYDSMEMLKDKGFVSSTIVNNRNVFEAVSPERILEILDEKKAGVASIMPRLMAKQGKKQSAIKIFTGLSGRKIVFNDKLNHLCEQYVLGAHEPSEKSSRFIENYHRRRVEKKIALKMLFVENEKNVAKRFKKYKLVKARILPEKFSSPIAVNIYANKVAILLGSGAVEPITIMIEDADLANDFVEYFKLLWKISRPV
jgi:sugar-specific transcriptional regulator TrmB